MLSESGTYDRLHRLGSRLRAGLEESGRRHGIPTHALGEDACFGVRFIDKPADAIRSWADLLGHDKDLGRRWAIECIKGGLLLNPNEKFYISLAHTDADIDQTIEAASGALRDAG